MRQLIVKLGARKVILLMNAVEKRNQPKVALFFGERRQLKTPKALTFAVDFARRKHLGNGDFGHSVAKKIQVLT